MEKVKAYLRQIVEISDEDWHIFSSKLKLQLVKKNEFLLKSGDIENQLSFISKGSCRYFLDRLDREITFGFSFSDEFVTGYDSLITSSPAQYNIQTLEDTELFQISKTDLNEIYKITKVGNFIGRKMAEQMYLKKASREIDLLNKSPETMYIELFETRPEVIKHIPLKHIASYIGITPQALSRIRKRIC
ncbi:MAG: Crp/Fnr family transcriptional regulator [Putridiphycobacter sp.]